MKSMQSHASAAVAPTESNFLRQSFLQTMRYLTSFQTHIDLKITPWLVFFQHFNFANGTLKNLVQKQLKNAQIIIPNVGSLQYCSHVGVKLCGRVRAPVASLSRYFPGFLFAYVFVLMLGKISAQRVRQSTHPVFFQKEKRKFYFV